jgi:hypothetical protein
MVSTNVVLADGHIPPSATVMVRVMIPPEAISAEPKVYVGAVVVPPLVNVPSPVLAHEMLPFAEVYPAGMANVSALAHTVAVVVAPGVAAGRGLMVRANVAVAGVHGPLLTFMVRVMTGPPVVSVAPKA